MLRLLFAWVLVNGLLVAPQWIYPVEGRTVAWFALEAPLLVGLLAALPRRRWSLALTTVVSLALIVVTVFLLVDTGFLASLGRPFNLFLDLYLVDAVKNLMVGNLGVPKSVGVLAGVILVFGLITWGLTRLLAPANDKIALAPRLSGVALIALFALGVDRGAQLPVVGGHMDAPTVRLAEEQAEQFRLTRAERKNFAAELASAPDSYAGTPGLLAQLNDEDVLLTFIEAYGISAYEDPEWKLVMRPKFDEMATRLAAAGLYVATGKLLSSTQGGQSWYAHGTVTSGLWLNTQLRYDLLMASKRETLVDDFRRAGHATAAVMPAITTQWAEGERLGYDEVFTAANMDYQGPPLYWVTMPDQFTLSFLQKTVRPRANRVPQFVETALVSSHIPWTPIVPMLLWDSIGNGSVFAPFEAQGAPPGELFDPEQLRVDYPKSLSYSLDATIGFAENYVDDKTLFIVLGDHQPVPWVTGEDVTRDVPIHVITRDKALLEPFLAWGFSPGTYPNPTQPEHRMDEFRSWFVHAFSDSTAAVPEGARAHGESLR